jgi:hypothetical protein
MILEGNALTRAQPAIRDEEIVSRLLRLPSGQRKIFLFVTEQGSLLGRVCLSTHDNRHGDFRRWRKGLCRKDL